LFTLRADQANGTDPDLLIDSLTPILRMTIVDTIASFCV
jgi:hypothetical protein